MLHDRPNDQPRGKPGSLSVADLMNFSVTKAPGRGTTMMRSNFTEAQIAFILRQADEGTAVGEVCRNQ
jgi:hypothetical protein